MSASQSRLGGVAAFALILALVPAEPALAADGTVFTFVGGGWGHSVGMSQYGAFGMAKEGATSGEIISQYYTGASVGVVDASYMQPLWVSLRSGQSQSVDIEVTATGGSPAVPLEISNGGGSLAVQPGEVVTFEPTGPAECTVTAPAGVLVGPCDFDGEWDGDAASPTTMLVVGDCEIGLCQYARGSLRIRPHSSASTFNVSLEIEVEDYMLGIAEMPYDWGLLGGQAALEAQAIAARSYAVRTAYDRGSPAFRPSCSCHLYATNVDQTYLGWGYGTQTWIDAVTDTAGEVVTHPDDSSGGQPRPIKAFYSSSTYGWTESSANGFGGADTPWLQEVDDHWSANPDLNPLALWSKQFTGAQLATVLNAKGANLVTVDSISVTECSDSGAILELRFRGEGASFYAKTRDLRSWLGLRSMQVLRVGAPPPPTPTCPSPIGDLPQGSLPGDLVESVGLHDPATGIFTLHRPGSGVDSFYFGNRQDIPFTGDWNCDEVTTLGLYRVSTGFLFLRNTNTQGIADIEIYYGNPGDRPLAGDWDGDGCETVGIYRPSQARFYLRNSNTQGIADVDVAFGNVGDQPIVGDWNGDGYDTIGVYRPSTTTLYLSNALGGGADIVYTYTGAQVGDVVIVGDWDGDGVDGVGLFRPSTATFYLRNDFTGGSDFVFSFGDPTLTPVTGVWDRASTPNLAGVEVRRARSGRLVISETRRVRVRVVGAGREVR